MTEENQNHQPPHEENQAVAQQKEPEEAAPAQKPFYKPSDAFISSARENMTYYLVTAFGIVVAFAWNDAFKALIEEYFPVTENGVWPQFLYAIIITIILVIVTAFALQHIGRRKDSEEK